MLYVTVLLIPNLFRYCLLDIFTIYNNPLNFLWCKKGVENHMILTRADWIYKQITFCELSCTFPLFLYHFQFQDTFQAVEVCYPTNEIILIGQFYISVWVLN